MTIPISIEPKDYIKIYLSILNPILKLRTREREVLYGMITIYLNLKKEIIAKRMTEDEVDKRMNDTCGRKIIADYIKMSRHSYNNHYSRLKTKGIITKDDRLPSYLKINPTKLDFQVIYKIKIESKKIESKPESKSELKSELKPELRLESKENAKILI